MKPPTNQVRRLMSNGNQPKKFSRTTTSLLTAILLTTYGTTAFAEGKEADFEESDWQVRAGFGVYAFPESQGSDELEILPLPFIDVTYKDRYFFNFFDGLGGYLYKSDGDGFNLKSSIGFGFGREEDDDPILEGTGDIDDAATFKVEAEYKIGKISPFISIQKYLDGTDGIQGEIGVEGFFTLGENPYTSPSIMVSVAAEYSDEDHMVGFFGVNDQQSLRSGLPTYTPEAGFSAANAQVSFIYPFAKKWSVTTTVEYSQLIGDAADSPLVIKEDQVSGGLFFTYSF